ncbi:MAG: nitroreductase family protein [Chloroflexota bacterium]|nr:nitroreductase family protein [Chloroflexota bacterium]
MDFFDVTNTQRAMRRLKPDSIPEADLWKLLDTAIMAPNGGNLQPWNFVVIRDPEKKRKIAEWYLEGWEKSYGPAREAMTADPARARTYNSADYLARHLADVPVLVLATLRRGPIPLDAIAGASIYPAVQNLMLAARALGLGTTLTTLHKFHEKDVKALLGIPESVETMALIPIGIPRGKFGTPSRMPAEKVVFWDSWSETRPRT